MRVQSELGSDWLAKIHFQFDYCLFQYLYNEKKKKKIEKKKVKKENEQIKWKNKKENEKKSEKKKMEKKNEIHEKNN